MKTVCSLLAALWLGACAAPDIETYRQQTPVFDPAHYFTGRTEAWGMFQKRDGEVIKRFKVDIDGRRDGDRLILDERFVYSDGSRQQRIWTLTPDGPGRWRGRADDVIGEAVGDLAGNALHWRYRLRLPVDGSEYEVDFDDWMFLADDRTLINRASMRKFGIELGQVTLFFRKRCGEAPPCSDR
ncbi:DUF3833 domain-containing protein [Jeongeupia naejangsanensis]|uniref:DUF3833 domain-containing protein n=1 Tax=Jeongeupia naejangsanensis TaxID=613195 RepID=A0ABS2BR43_9NEIS|nr:DUF3833 domain-containing protein [Jeongeupia naejangsanensis]MBM3117259.1 DUF3833 domain-containing protein [Jeongeupia naejangsanensis]